MAIEAYKLAATKSGSDIEMLNSLGTLSGVWIELVAGRNGRGVGTLRYDGSDSLSWRAPGSDTHGTAVDVSGGGSFWLADGEDDDKWVKVAVTAASLPTNIQSAQVRLGEVYNNAVASGDVSVNSIGGHAITLTNNSTSSMTNITAWLDPDTPDNHDTKIRWTGSGSYVQPWNETEALTLFGAYTLAASASETFSIYPIPTRVTPQRHLRIFVSFDDGDGGRAVVELRGVHRVYTDAYYEAYQASGADPVPGVTTPVDTNATVPWTPADTFGDATHHLALCYVNRYGLRSTPKVTSKVRIVSGAEANLLPNDPDEIRVIQTAGGTTRVMVRYRRPVDSDELASQIAIWYTDDGSTPGSGDPDFTETIRWVQGGYGLMVCDDIPALGDGTTLKILAKAKAGSLYSPTGVSTTETISIAGPTAPPDGHFGPPSGP